MNTDDEGARAGIPEDATISNPSRPFVRLRGSLSSPQPILARTLRRRPPNGDGDPGPDDGPPPPPPPPPVSTPDLGIQLAICLPDDRSSDLVSAVRQALGSSADVRTACINNSQRVGVWLHPAVNDQDNQARNRGLERFNVIGAGEGLAFFINSALIRRQAFDTWNDPVKTPKRRNGDGDPDPNGPVHLTAFGVDFVGPNKIVTRIDGFDERPWPDVDFVLTITDTLSAAGGEVRCDSQRNLDVDTSWLNFLTGLFLLVLPPLGIVFLVERIIVGSRDAPDVDAGAGGSVPAMIPQEILIPAGLKVVAFYSRLDVFPGAIVAGGTFDVVPRTPAVTISGPTLISVTEGTASVTRSYTLHTDDLRPPFHDDIVALPAALASGTAARIPGGVPGPERPRPRIAWSGDGVALRPGAETTGFRFNLADAHLGQIVTRRVAVLVVDTDGLSASAELFVRIHITPADTNGDFPPICKLKPLLPQCQEPMARLARSRRKEPA
jgi:hypothetical protein